jgi:N6-L-threonylcarbamoyladenine synthase
VLNLTKRLGGQGRDLREPRLLADLAAAFQQAVADVLVEKTANAALTTGARQVCICGGVSANRVLRDTAAARLGALGIPLYIPPLMYCTDNAAMIGAAAYYRWRTQPLPDGLAMDVHASLPLPEEEGITQGEAFPG